MFTNIDMKKIFGFVPAAMRKVFRVYKDNIWYSVSFVFIVHIIQIPHMIWNTDMLLDTRYISRQNPVIDFILYGVDLLEIPSIIQVGLLWVYHYKLRKHGNRQ